MNRRVVVSAADELYEYANHLRWAAEDMSSCYQKVERHTSELIAQWKDDAAKRFMDVLEREERIIREIEQKFAEFDIVVRKRAEIVQEYVECGKKFSF